MFCFIGGECLGLSLCPHGFTQAPRELLSSQAQGSVGGLQQGSAGMHVLVGPLFLPAGLSSHQQGLGCCSWWS